MPTVTWYGARLWVDNGLVAVPLEWVWKRSGFGPTTNLYVPRGKAPRERALAARPVVPAPRQPRRPLEDHPRVSKRAMSWQAARRRDWDAITHMEARFNDRTHPRTSVDRRLEDGFAMLEGEGW